MMLYKVVQFRGAPPELFQWHATEAGDRYFVNEAAGPIDTSRWFLKVGRIARREVWSRLPDDE